MFIGQTSIASNCRRQGGTTTVSGTPTPLSTGNEDLVKGLMVANPSANTVWIGGSNVTADNVGGFPIAAGQCVSLPFNKPSELYVISAAGSDEVSWMGA